MNSEITAFLSLEHPPARLDRVQAAWYLGFLEHEISLLVRARLLVPLGNPAPNGTKYFALVDLQAKRSDSKWLSRATDAIQRRWRAKNGTPPTGTNASRKHRVPPSDATLEWS